MLSSLFRGRRRTYLDHREHARMHVHARLAHWNQRYGLRWGRVSIKDHRAIWGSCSNKGNLNFNYRVVFLPPAIADYVIVHELCHLQEQNHSRRFWDLVATGIPNYRELRQELRGYNVR